jgi:hypothetical protein
VITGRGPGAPGMTPDAARGLEFTRRRAGEAVPGTVAADLGEIRRAGQAIDLAAARAAIPTELRDDPALALLTALAADVDTPGTGVERKWVDRRAPSRGPARAACAEPPRSG